MSLSRAYAQDCNITTDIIICDMETIDHDDDGNADGIINLFEEYTKATGGLTLDTSGTWSIENSLSLPLNEETGDVGLWEYRFSSASPLAEYTFELLTTSCGEEPAATINIELGSFSGIALQPSIDSDINLEVCDSDIIDLFEALTSNEFIPAPHLNGIWEEISRPENIEFATVTRSGILSTEILYQEGTPLVDKGEFEFRYIIPETDNCPQTETNIKVSVVRQVRSGNEDFELFSGEPRQISISENSIINGDHDIDIDLRDDIYLEEEDIEGFWSVSPYLEDRNDSVINIRDIYNSLNLMPDYESVTFSFTYNVDKRSGVCDNSSTIIFFTIFEELKPFFPIENPDPNPNNGGCFSICKTSQTQVDLYEYIEFAEVNGVTFEYDNDNYVNWRYNREQGSEVQTIDFGLNEQPDFLNEFDSTIDYSLGTISLENIPPGEYEFEYAVSSSVLNPEPGSFCDPFESILEDNFCDDPFARGIETVKICVLVEDFNYAGENTTGIEICENEGTVILTDYLEVTELLGEISLDGEWTDENGIVFPNDYEVPNVDVDTNFLLTYTTVHPVTNCEDSANLSFTLINENSIGSVGESIIPDNIIRLCTNDLNIVLFDQLQGADPIGQWTGPRGYISQDHEGAFVFNDQTQQDIVEGEYVYTIGNGLDCSSIESITLTIQFVNPIELVEEVVRTFCKEDGTTIDLITLLETSAPKDGVFTDVGDTGVLTGSVFDFSVLEGGRYEFQYSLDIAPCEIPTQIIVIEVIDENNPPSAGISPSEPIKVCSDDLTIKLFEQLEGSPSTLGSWTGNFGYNSNGDHEGTFINDDLSLPILGSGTYIYTIDIGTCNTSTRTSSVTIELVDPVELGNDVFASFCKVEGGVNLFSLLDSSTSALGLFTGIETTDSLTNEGFFDFTNLPGGVYNFQYSIPNEAPCAVSSLNVEINVIELEAPKVLDTEFCILDAKNLNDIEVLDQLDVPILNFNWYESLEDENPIIDNPVISDAKIYFVTNIDAEGCESTRVPIEFNILNLGETSEIDPLIGCPLVFQDGVSADGNNINDTFDTIKEGVYNLPEAFPDFNLEIFNRYGVMVYKAGSTTSEFDGKSNVSLSIGEDLPSGVYFYIFNPNFKNNSPVQGSFYLSK